VGQKLSKNLTTISDWSSKYRWVARAAAYDEQIAELVSLAETKAIGAKAKEWAERKRSIQERAWEKGR